MNYISDILLIDDQIEEAYEIQKNFLKMGFNPVISKPQEITESFSMSPSIIFCDINLLGTDDDINFKLIKGILKKIYKKNTPYILILWTSHSDKITELENCIRADREIIQPLEITSMDKNNISVIENNLKTLLDRINFEYPDFTVFAIFKYIISKANNDTVDLLNNLYNIKEGKFINLLVSIAEQSIGEKNIKGNEACALSTPISYFIKNSIDKNIYKKELHSDLINIFKNVVHMPKNDLDQKLKAKINTVMHINMNTQDNITIPGDYIKTNISTIRNLLGNKKITKKILLEKITRSNIPIFTCQIGLIEITADCDFAQHKTMGICKYAFAYLCPPESFTKDKLPRYYQSIDIEYNKKIYKLIVDARFIISSNHNDIKSCKKLFNIRESLFKKIRQDIYVQNSRLGTISF